MHFSWGSSLLEPIQRVIPCPRLKPGEIGSIEALLHVPKICGRYQMYWHFHHKGRKFGHWLGCEIIVDNITSTEQLSTSFLRNIASRIENTTTASKIDPEFITPYGSLVDSISTSVTEEQLEKDMSASIPIVEEKMKDVHISENTKSSSRNQPYQALNKEIEEVVINKSPSKIQIIEKYFDNIDDSCYARWNFDAKNNSTESIQKENNIDINAGGGEESHSESISKIDEETSSNSTLNDMVMVNFPDEVEEQPLQGYAYVEIDGVKTAVPKRYLRADYLETAQDAPDPNGISIAMTDFYGVEMMNAQYNGDSAHNFRAVNEDDEVPDLISSDRVADRSADTVSKKNCISENEHETPVRHFIFPERFAGYEIISDNPQAPKEELVEFDVKGDEDEKNTERNGTQQPANVPYEPVFASAPPTQTLYADIITSSNVITQENLAGHDLILPHIPNYQQTPPEFRSKVYPDIQEYPKESGQIRYSAKPEIVSITTRNGVDLTSHDAMVAPNEIPASSSRIGESDRQRSVPEASVPISSVVTEAMTMASSALKTVVNKIIPPKNEELGVWVNGHWVTTAENSIRENNLKTLADMGFMNRDLNASLLSRYDDDIRRVVTELVQ